MKILFCVGRKINFMYFGIGILSALAKEHGHQSRLVATGNIDDIQAMIDGYGPDVFAMHVDSSDCAAQFGLLAAVKAANPKLVTIIGGPHPTYFPECVKEPGVDYAILGEAEWPLLDLLQCIEAGTEPGEIKNVISKARPTTEFRVIENDLDRYPAPDHDLFYESSSFLAEFPIKAFMASRGCPFNCTYCFNHKFNRIFPREGPLVRKRSVEHVIREIEHVKSKYPLQLVRFLDDVLFFKIDDWALEFREQYMKRINLPFNCHLRVEVVSEEVVDYLKSMGCNAVGMAIESGNEAFRKKRLRRNMSNAQILKAFELCRSRGINTFVENILALPGTTFENDLETLDLNIRCRPSLAQASILVPYHGTDIARYAVENGLLDPNYTISAKTFFNPSILNFDPETKKKQYGLMIAFPILVAYPGLKNLILPLLDRKWAQRLLVPVLYYTRYKGFKHKVFPHSQNLRLMMHTLTRVFGAVMTMIKGE